MGKSHTLAGGWSATVFPFPSWPAASILYLEGAELSILKLNTNEQLCVKFKFLSKLSNHHKRVRRQLHWTVFPSDTSTGFFPKGTLNGKGAGAAMSHSEGQSLSLLLLIIPSTCPRHSTRLVHSHGPLCGCECVCAHMHACMHVNGMAMY